ncbi:hypothetical protein ACFS5M_12805 [Lacinutrix iliipiscaria]|uniref:Uncharacterized protein n=1 Tax=Lacinutrix iliipiscaria TaxID=1230532 RepID=A0ABW5WQD3_9FLAO
MKIKLLVLIFLISSPFFAQENAKISSIDFVQIQGENFDEAMHYYQNNWETLRIKALENNYIESYQLLKSNYSEEAPFHLILITTYKNASQFEKREDHFQKLIDNLGELNLLNDLKPSDFRKVLFGTDAKHLN